MTNKEAIEFLSQIMDSLLASNSWLPSTHNPIKESFGMAINALTAQPETHDKRTETHARDCISRQAAIDTVEESRRLNHHQDGKAALAHEHEHRHFLKILIELPPAQPEQRWIPSGEKPPEKGSYLVWMPFAPPKHRMTVAEYCGGYWNIKTPISAWMPLPEPYKEGTDDQ